MPLVSVDIDAVNPLPGSVIGFREILVAVTCVVCDCHYLHSKVNPVQMMGDESISARTSQLCRAHGKCCKRIRGGTGRWLRWRQPKIAKCVKVHIFRHEG